MAVEMYRQCALKREYTPGFFSNMVSFIPFKFAVQDMFLKLKNEKGEWENGWQVVGMGVTMTKDEVDYRSRDARRMREKDA